MIYRILVADDRIDDRQFLTTLLSYRGHRLLEAADGAEALALVRAERPDLVITDILMPVMDGYEFVRQLRADPVVATTPVIFYTATYLERESHALAQKCSVTHLLTKPMEPEAILRTVEEVLALSRSSAPLPVPPEVDQEHRRMLTDTLVRKVKELEVEVAHRQQAEAALRERERLLRTLSRKLLNAQEAERRRIARELHDEVGQTLTAVKIQLQGLLLSGDAAAPRPGMEGCIATVEQLLGQVRTLSVDLRPSLLDDLGLVAALRSHVARQARLANLTAKVSADGLGALTDPELETACFRLAQETLTNVIRHAGAKTVRIDLRRIDNDLHVIIRDDGSGFDVTAAHARAARGDSLGLVGMRERVTLLGGRFRIRSAPGRGTTVHASFPLVGPVGDPPEPGR